jgi:uncharacterized protein
MKTAKTIFTLVLIILIFFWIKGHSQTTENALLWEVSGNGLKDTSYIYGTMHLLCEEDYMFSEDLAVAFQKSDNVVLELDMDAPDFMAQMQREMVSSVPLSQKLSPQDFKTLDSILISETSMSLTLLDNMNLQVISMILIAKYFPCEKPESYEMDLISMAKESQKEVIGLETVAQQMAFYRKAFSDEFLLKQIFEMEGQEKIMQQMVESYKKQDLNELYTYVTDEKYADKETEKWLLIERNRSWVKLLPGMMEKETNLIAVGAAHLIGEEGLIQLLRSAGYTVKPVKN